MRNPGKQDKNLPPNPGAFSKRLAEILKVDPCTLSRWEKGKGRPTKEFLQIVVDFFVSLKASQTALPSVKGTSIC